jgi:LacI family transcriptional regulator
MKTKTVLMFLPVNDSRAAESAEAVRIVSARFGWNFFSAEISRSGDGAIRLERSSRPTESAATLADMLRPDGIIVWRWAISPAEVRSITGRDIPAVFIHRNRDGLMPAGGAVCVHWDSESIASLAARRLLFSGYGDFAFVPWKIDADFSRDYGAAFAHCIEIAGKRFHRFDWPLKGDEGAVMALGRWLESLPKPCGIFAINDIVGEEILSTCASIGIAVPDDIAVVAVGNRTHVCEATRPTLSSIVLDRHAEGVAAVELLDGWMRHPGHTPTSRAIPASHVALRASSRFARDRRVAAALENIRLNACEEKFGPCDVARGMRVSRTHADRLFRATLGRTILDEIHAARLERAKELLREGKRPDYVGALCGYASHDDFRRVFRNRVGMTIRKWMIEHHV